MELIPDVTHFRKGKGARFTDLTIRIEVRDEGDRGTAVEHIVIVGEVGKRATLEVNRLGTVLGFG